MINETYEQMLKRHSKELDAYSVGHPFNDIQFKEMLLSCGLNVTDADKVYRIDCTTGYFLKSDEGFLQGIIKRQKEEIQARIDEDVTGEGFVYDMFSFEFALNETIISYTLNALDLTLEQVKADKKLLHGLNEVLVDYGERRI